MPLIRGTGGQSATAERYTAAANGRECRRSSEHGKTCSKLG